MDKAIKEFAKRMQYKLDRNKHKEDTVMNKDGTGRHWSKCDNWWLYNRIRDEFYELRDALKYRTKDEIMNECADVANFAMMIFDNIKRS